MGFTARGEQLLRHPIASARAVARRARRLARARGATPCLVCGSRRTHVTTVQRKRRAYDIRVCEACGYLSNFTNTVDYSAFQSVESFKLSPRVGTAQHQGREFHMAQMGVAILRRPALQAMVFGAGRSLDYQHIARLPTVARVVMSDVVELTGEADFVNITEGTDERFDLIIACEVVEHFEDPRAEFRRLFELLTPGGLLVCSTNVYDGGNFAKHTYLYLRGHVSYYTPRALTHIARRSGLTVDFRTPAIAQGSVGPRKRYLLFTRSPEVVARTDEYFVDRPYAPSEDVAAFEALHEVEQGVTGN
ncbi:class I SAM-dependent methyltransferase [Aeromicrobium stalagmiti]|uniref:class I SAM-dependent methyltransferase n=1 Tax=Aeromicrobium stalagmiti TaxID=2738988 RepID=UPI00156804F3|nr:class I SAM-dependent methyltransferase [Aeromicrobium stalagmiti]NRQ49378.1 class I SAM-dependent methyltransferase [Aeromicrobium stalagmiti]